MFVCDFHIWRFPIFGNHLETIIKVLNRKMSQERVAALVPQSKAMKNNYPFPINNMKLVSR